jgi:hypothetical protein
MIIGLSGYARSGKDTVGGMLVGLHTYDNRAFAAPLKTALELLNPFIQDNMRLKEVLNNFGWEQSKDLFPEVRRLLQVLGKDVGRDLINENVWINTATKDLKPNDKVVFTDVRFPNEAAAIKLLGGEVWRINRPGVEATNSHASETSMDNWKFDAVIQNDKDMDNLINQIRVLLG